MGFRGILVQTRWPLLAGGKSVICAKFVQHWCEVAQLCDQMHEMSISLATWGHDGFSAFL